jgi:hypothetical protein
VSGIVLDAGPLLGVDRGDRKIVARLATARQHGRHLRTNAMVLAQAWRGRGSRQALLVRLLRSVDVRTIDEHAGRAAGQLLGRSGTSDPIDASIVLLAAEGDAIMTSDPDEIRILADAVGVRVRIIPC